MGDCGDPDCKLTFPHYHDVMVSPNGNKVDAIIHLDDCDPRAEVRDSETGEVIFPAVKGPLRVIKGGRK